MRFLVLTSLILFLTFTALASKENISIKLQCVGDLEARPISGNTVYQKDFVYVVEIIDNIFQSHTLMDLDIGENTIWKKIDETGNKLKFLFQLDRYNGKFVHFESQSHTGTDYSWWFKGKCEKLENKLF